MSPSTAVLLYTIAPMTHATPISMKNEMASDPNAVVDKQTLPYFSLSSSLMSPWVLKLGIHSPLSCTALAVYVSSSTVSATTAVAGPTAAAAWSATAAAWSIPAVAGPLMLTAMPILGQHVMLSALAAISATSAATSTAVVAIRQATQATDPVMGFGQTRSHMSPGEVDGLDRASQCSTARLPLALSWTGSELQLYIPHATCQMRAVSADSSKGGLLLHTAAFVQGQQLFSAAAFGSVQNAKLPLLVHRFPLLPFKFPWQVNNYALLTLEFHTCLSSLLLIIKLVGFLSRFCSERTYATLALMSCFVQHASQLSENVTLFQVPCVLSQSHLTMAASAEETNVRSCVKDVQQVNEANVVHQFTSGVSTRETVPSVHSMVPANHATQSAGVQHGQEQPTLAAVLQKLDVMQVQMNAMQHSIDEAMAEATFWRIKYAEAAGLV